MKDRYWTRKLVVEPHHDEKLLKDIWGEPWGVRNAVDPLRQVLMHRPGKEILKLHKNAREIEAGPVLSGEIKGRNHERNSRPELPDYDRIRDQHDTLADTLRKEGVIIRYLQEDAETDGFWPERMFTRDMGMVIPGGVILSRFALYIRYGESRLMSRTLAHMGVPILGAVQGNGLAEGGSFTLLDEKTALIGRSERVNLNGIEQIRHILAVQDIELWTIDLPSTIIHLDEAYLMIDRDKALVNTSLLPFWFLDELHRRGIELFHVDPGDHPLSINAITVSPGRVIFSSSGVKTMELLDRHGIHVIPVDVSEIFKLGGGIHCVTLPLVRHRPELGE